MNVESLADEYLDRLRRGENPSVAEYVDRYPELAEEIREFFPAMKLVENFKPDSRDASLGEMAVPSATGATVPRRLGDYHILREIGRGGMGVVCEAVQESLGRPVALKVLPPHVLRDARRIKRFEREARAAARLHHTNIVPVFGVGEVDGLRYYAMQFIHGLGLDQVLDEVRRLRMHTKAPATDAPLDKVTKIATVAAFANAHVAAPAAAVTAAYAAESLMSGCFTCHLELRTDSTTDAGACPRPQRAADTVVDRASDVAPYALPGQAANDSGSGSLAAYWRSVAQIGVQVAEALQYSNDHGILHRDIKPSNLLLDGRGTVWITDFGLAKTDDHEDLTQTGDVVGTLRYMAPELFQSDSDGRSDVYSLGLTLYELLALRPAFDATNRAQLIHQVVHESPPRLRSIDRHIPRDLETIVHKAIERDRRHRYQTAHELAADLQRYLGDEPIRARRISPVARLQRWCRRNKAIAAMSMILVALLVSAAVVSTAAAVAFRGQRNDLNLAVEEIGRTTVQVREERDKALNAERDKTDHLVDALYEKVRGNRLAGRMGRRFQGLASLTEAAEYLQSLNLPPDELQERQLLLRNEAIACLALPDFQDQAKWDLSIHADFEVDPQQLHYAQVYEPGVISLKRLADHAPVGLIAKRGSNPRYLRYSPDGKRLAVAYRSKSAGDSFTVWDTANRTAVVEAPLAVFGDLIDFSRDGSYVAAASTKGTVHVFRLSTGQEFKMFTGAQGPRGLRFSPDGQQLALSTASGKLLIRNLVTGSLLPEWSAPRSLHGIDWSPDGKTIAAACESGNVYLHHIATNQNRILKGHRHDAARVAFHPQGRFLYSSGWDGTTRLWELSSQTELLQTNGSMRGMSADGSQIAVRLGPGTKVAVRGFDSAAECRPLFGHFGATHVHNSAFSPSLSLTATCGSDGVRLWNSVNWQELVHLELGWTISVAFHPRTGHLWTSGERGVFEWPLRTLGSTQSAEYRLGPPRHVETPDLAPCRLVFSADGGAMAVNSQSGEQHVLIFREKTSAPVRAINDQDCRFTALSPDGRWLAVGSWKSSGAAVFDATNGNQVQEFKSASATAVDFSPDGKWLATCEAEAVRFYRVGSWELSHSYPAPGLGYVTFSPDSALVAMGSLLAGEEPNSVHLIRTTTGKLLAKLENTPAPIQIEQQITFSADGSQLVVPHWRDCSFCAWDLRAIRGRLQDIGLDWDAPPLPPATEAQGSIKVSVIGPMYVSQLLDRLGYGYVINKQDARIIDDALAELTLAIQSDVHDPTWCVLRGRLNWVLGRDREARADFNEALARDPGHVAAYYYRGFAHWWDHKLPEAIADYEEVLCREPRHSRALLEASMCYVYCPPFRPNAERALALTERCLKADKDSSVVVLTQGIALYHLGRLDEAEQTIGRAIRLRVGWRRPSLTLAAIYQERGETERARALFHKAQSEGVGNSPQNAKEIHGWSAEVARRLGLTDTMVERQPHEPLVLDGLTLLLSATATEGRMSLRTTGQPASTLALDWSPSHPGARLTCHANVAQAGRYRIAGQFRSFEAHGRVQVSVAGHVRGKPFDGFSTKQLPSGEIVFGEAELAGGNNDITLEITGSHSQSSGYRVWLEQIVLTPVAAATPTDEKP